MANDRVIFDAQSARRIIAQTRAGEGRFRHEPQAEEGVVVPPSPIMNLVRVTSLTPTGSFYPGVWAHDDVVAGGVIEHTVIWIHFPNGETPTSTSNYNLARFIGPKVSDGVGVYAVIPGGSSISGPGAGNSVQVLTGVTCSAGVVTAQTKALTGYVVINGNHYPVFFTLT